MACTIGKWKHGLKSAVPWLYPQQHAVLFVVLAPRRSPRRTSWNPRGTLVERWWNPGGTLVEPLWNPRGTLPQGRPVPPRSLSGLRPQSFRPPTRVLTMAQVGVDQQVR